MLEFFTYEKDGSIQLKESAEIKADNYVLLFHERISLLEKWVLIQTGQLRLFHFCHLTVQFATNCELSRAAYCNRKAYYKLKCREWQ